jgi:putative proteasome-type protease
MTYCVAMKLDEGLVFLSDSRTNAGVDAVSTFRKMTLFERRNDRVIMMMTSGNLAISQAIKHYLINCGDSIWNAENMFEVAELVGEAVRHVYKKDGSILEEFDIKFNVGILLGGQVQGEPMRLFMIYSAGNFIEATDENCFFQIGENKYGKPIIDRVVEPDTSLDEAAKCALISMASTLNSNISVGLPLDLLVYEVDSFKVEKFVHITEENQYFEMISQTWGQRLREVFSEIQEPIWKKHPKNIFEINESPDDNLESLENIKINPPDNWM